MAVTPEPVPPSVDSDGFLTVWLLDGDEVDDPAAIPVGLLTDEKRVTYSMTPSGFNFRPSTTSVERGRLSLVNVPRKSGRISLECSAQYVYGDENDVMDPLVVKGKRAVVVARYSIENGTAPAPGQDIETFVGAWDQPIRDLVTENTDQTKTANFLASMWEPNAEIVAGG